jgi:two-component system, cell cycle response regulator
MTLARQAAARRPPARGELAPISERAAVVQLVRGGFAVVIVASALLGPDPTAGSRIILAASALVYVAVTGSPIPFINRGSARVLGILQAALLVDGAYLAYVMYVTGGTASPLRLLVYVHLVAVTLLASYRTGLKIALWHTLLFLVMFEVEAHRLSGYPGAPSGGDAGPALGFPMALQTGGFWLVAIATAAFSSLNERALRSQKADLERLSRMVAEMDRSERPPDIARILLESLRETFGFSRGAVLASREGEPVLLASVGAVGRAAIEPGVDPVMERAWTERDVLLVRRLDRRTDERLARLFPDARNVLIAPLYLAGGRRLGILACEQPHSERMAGWIVAMVRQFASHGALALHNAWLAADGRRQLHEIESLSDEVTRRNAALKRRVARLEADA